MLIEQIRTATAHHHEQLEKALFPYLQSLTTNDDYAKLLKAFYGYIAPVENLVTQHINRDFATDLDQRRSANRLLDDLSTIGQNTEVAVATDLPPINDSPSAFGALYVLEGSTLGGKMISKMIAEKLGITEGISFFKGYGPETGSMWKEFLQQLENDDNQSHAEQVTKTASETFRLFEEWLKKAM